MDIKQISLTAARKNSSRFQRRSIDGAKTTSAVAVFIDKLKSLLNMFITLVSYVKKFLKSTLFMIGKSSGKGAGLQSRRETSRIKRLGKKLNPKKFIKPLLITVVAVIFLVAAQRLIRNIDTGNGNGAEEVEVKGAKASQDINKEFSFPLRGEDGENLSDVKYTLEKAELLDEIIVRGEKATSVKGRTFLIITLKVKNEYKSDIEMDTRDYIRLSVNGNTDEWLAPEIHNDPVEVQAISTKYTRVGFVVDDSDKDLVLRVGEIDGEKEEVPLDLN